MKTMILVLTIVLYVGADVAFGQTTDTTRVFVAVNAGVQAGMSSSTQKDTLTISAEQGSDTVVYPLKSATMFDVGGGVRVWKRLAVGVAVSRYDKAVAATVDASIPHPFFFGRSRSISGSTDPLTHQETGVHLDAMWMVPVARKLGVAVFGGPTYFSVSQDIVQAVRYTEAYPYDTATFTGVTVAKQTKSKVGFNAGADVTYMLSKVVGVGGVIRFSRATVDFGGAGSALPVDVGGVQAGGGLRLRF